MRAGCPLGHGVAEGRLLLVVVQMLHGGVHLSDVVDIEYLVAGVVVVRMIMHGGRWVLSGVCLVE